MQLTVRQLRKITLGKHPETVVAIKEDGTHEIIEHIPQTGGRKRLDWQEIWDLYANEKLAMAEIGRRLGVRRQSVRNVIRKIEHERERVNGGAKKKILPVKK